MISDPLSTGDGSLTFHHPEVGEAYHSLEGAASEALAKFILPSELRQRCHRGPVVLWDIGFGLGYNCRAAMACVASHPLIIHSFEQEPAALARSLQLFPDDPLTTALQQTGRFVQDQVTVTLHLGDLRQRLQEITTPVDLIFHDPFSPLRNSECWTVELFRLMHNLLAPDGALLTYSQSRIVRQGLHEAGFLLRDTPEHPPHRGGTLACKQGEGIEIAPTHPFHDPDLNLSGHEIRSQREASLRRFPVQRIQDFK